MTVLMNRWNSAEEAHKAHTDKYRSDGVLKNIGNPHQCQFYRASYFIDQVEKNSKVLDVGCNAGTLGIHLLRKDCHVNGIDIVKELVEKAKNRGIYAEEGIAEDLSRYDDNSFDYVLCGEVLEHLFDPYPAVKEAHRVLKPGGKYIFTVPHPTSFMCTDRLGDYHQQNFTLEMLDTMVHNFFEKGDATFIEIPYTETYNLSEGIKPIGDREDGTPVYPPQWLGVTAIKKGATK